MGGRGSNQYQSKPGGKGPRMSEVGGPRIGSHVTWGNKRDAMSNVKALKKMGIPAKIRKTGSRGSTLYTLHTTRKGNSAMGFGANADWSRYR